MKNLITVCLAMLTSVVCIAQENLYKYIGSDFYSELSDFDSSYTFNQSRNFGLPLGFQFDDFGTSRIIISEYFTELVDIDGYHMTFSPYSTSESLDTIVGFIKSDSAVINVKYHYEANEIVATTFETKGIYYENYPNHKIDFQFKIHKTGHLEFHYGKNELPESFEGYDDFSFHWNLAKETAGNFDILNYICVTGDVANPEILSYEEVEEYNGKKFYSFNRPPNKNLSFSINARQLATGIKEKEQNNFELSLDNKQLHIICKKSEKYRVLVSNLSGQNLMVKDGLTGTTNLALPEKHQIIVVKIETSNEVFTRKILIK